MKGLQLAVFWLILFTSLSLMLPLIEDIIILRAQREPILLVTRLHNPTQFPHNQRFLPHNLPSKSHAISICFPHPVRSPVRITKQ